MRQVRQVATVEVTPEQDPQVQEMHEREQQRRQQAQDARRDEKVARAAAAGARAPAPDPEISPAPAHATHMFRSERPLTLAMAIKKVAAHGYAVSRERGLEASVRRACAAAMQMPTGSSTTGKMAVTATIVNIPRHWISTFLLAAGWEQVESMLHSEFVTDYPKALGHVLALEKLGSGIGFGCAKLYKPEREPKAKALLAAIPPGRAVHRVREDGTEVLDLAFHLGVVNEVSSHVAARHA